MRRALPARWKTVADKPMFRTWIARAGWCSDYDMVGASPPNLAAEFCAFDTVTTRPVRCDGIRAAGEVAATAAILAVSDLAATLSNHPRMQVNCL
jgi:hypothetical protein